MRQRILDALEAGETDVVVRAVAAYVLGVDRDAQTEAVVLEVLSVLEPEALRDLLEVVKDGGAPPYPPR